MDFPSDQTIHRLFEEQVNRTPDHTAAIFMGKKLTYRELNQRANSLANYLRNHGVKQDKIVGLLADRSLEMIVGIFGILKAGGAYMPVSPSNPGKRIIHMLEESGTHILLTQGKFVSKFDQMDSKQYQIINIDLEPPHGNTGNSTIYGNSTANPDHINTPNDLAYIIYTSGSTGKPKGVGIEHVSLINRLNWMQRKYPLTPSDVILQKTPFFFDVSVWEMFWWSIVGAGVCFLMPGGEKFPQAIIETTEKNKVTVMHFVPSMMSAFLEYLKHSAGDIKRLAPLRQVFASGEKLASSHASTFNEVLHHTNGTVLSNLYGPTEATIDVTYYDIPAGNVPENAYDKIPIGKPIDNTVMHIITEDNHLCPLGEIGELVIGGIGVARGYINRPELTAEKFVNLQLPTHSNTTNAKKYDVYYKTGDLACWLPDGNIEFHGRSDFQVKIHGNRIELGEIEAVLSKHPAVLDNVTVVKQYSKNITMIVAYILLKSNAIVSQKELKDYMKELLPEYMVPNLFITLDKFPLTPTGKVDRKALPEPSFT